ncbi:DUF2288 domain-containing protein [Kaarinaea lacus]
MTDRDDNREQQELLYHKLNLETGKIAWSELQRYFARGVIIIVAKELDLVEVAQLMTQDQKDKIDELLHQGLIKHATDDDAIHWNQSQQEFWAIVTAPWVLVQAIQ